MSCEECTVDPVLTLLETLADTYGYRLEPKQVPAQSKTAEIMARARDEFERLSIEQLWSRFSELMTEALRWDAEAKQWEQLFKKGCQNGLSGIYMTDLRAWMPQGLKDEIKLADSLEGLAKNILTRRLAEQALSEMTGASDVEEAIARMRVPNPANPRSLDEPHAAA